MAEYRTYSVRVDGFEITRVELGFEEYKNESARDEVRRKIALTYKVPAHYLRLCHVENTQTNRGKKWQ